MKHFLNLIILLCLTTFSYAQVNISGKVVDSTSNLPVADASVYINNTSIGTTTDSNGDFFLLSSLSGSFDLVISHVTFQRKGVHITTGDTQTKLLIALKHKSGELEGVTITDGSLKAWKKWRGLFTQYFIGNTEFAKKCRIENPEVLVFHYDKVNRQLKVTSNNTLLVENKALGYVYKIDLNDFTYSFNNLKVNTDITTFFKNITATDSTEQRNYAANRKQAFNGSKMHFIQSLYKRNYPRQGFSIIAIHLKQNPEKSRIQHLISDALAKAYQANKSSSTVTLASIANGDRDTVAYYERTLGQPDFVIKDTTGVALKDSLIFDKRYQIAKLHLKDTLLVQYTENHGLRPIAFKMPVKNANFTITDKQMSFSNKKRQGNMQYSILLLTPNKEINIYSNGGYDGNDIFTDGYMAQGKIAYLLPWDYKNSD